MNHTVGIVDDHKMFRKGLVEIISHVQNYQVIIEAEDGLDLLNQLEIHQPEILILDLKMPNMDGFEVLKRLTDKYSFIKVIALSMYDQEKFILHAFKLGAHGYLLKNHGPNELEIALKKVADDGFYFTDQVSKMLAKGLRMKSVKPSFSGINITDREKDILTLICDGHTNEEIGKIVYLSKRTVEGHRRTLIDKAAVRNTAGLVSWAFRNHLVE